MPLIGCMNDNDRRWLEIPGNRLLVRGAPAYPSFLQQINDPPDVLYARGRVELLDATCFAIVGSRNASVQGTNDATAFARELSEAGLTIVSGLALGIDAAAHRGGLSGKGSSIAVLGTGADITYPPRNRALAEILARDGCVISEFPLGMPALPWNFPTRNRLISGLSRGVLVVEAAMKSGSLGTAYCAVRQNRDVFAIPGSIHSPLAKGCHRLIKEGAKLVECAADVLLELGIKPNAGAGEADCDEREERHALLDAMGFAPVSIDQMAQRIGLDAAKLAALLSRFEIDGRIEALAGGWFRRVR
jgi:DNA processing protein